MPATELLPAEPAAAAARDDGSEVEVPEWVLDTWVEMLEYFQRCEAERQAAIVQQGETGGDVHP